MELLQQKLQNSGFNVGTVNLDWLVITSSRFDLMLPDQEMMMAMPYQTLSILYNVKSHHYILRTLGRNSDQGTFASEHILVEFCALLMTKSACVGIAEPDGSFPLSCRFSEDCSQYADSDSGSEMRCSACHKVRQPKSSVVLDHHDEEDNRDIKAEVEMLGSPKVEQGHTSDPDDELLVKIETQDILNMIQTKEESIPSVFQDIETANGPSEARRSRPARKASLKAMPGIHQAMIQYQRIPKVEQEADDEEYRVKKVKPKAPSLPKRVKTGPWEEGRKCPLCDKIMYKRNLYYRHLQKKHYSGKYVCHLCQVKLPVPKAVMDHLLEEHPGSPLEAHCPSCQVMINFDEDPMILGQHFLTCIQGKKVPKAQSSTEKKPVECQDCGKMMSTLYTLRVHVQKFHSTDVPVCHKCGYVAVNDRKLKIHLRAKHNEEMEFSDDSDNGNDLPTLCPYCACSLANAAGLKRHLKEHHASVKCPDCGQEFTKLRQYESHRVRVHEHDEFKCKICSMLCVNHGMLQRHLKTHRPPTIKCKFCDRMFRNSEGVKNHQRMHTGETPFK